MNWIILRCSGRSTLPLAESLGREGYRTYAPVMVHRVRVPRMNARRIVTEALMKGFVFADYAQRHELEILSTRPGRHADFRIEPDLFTGEFACVPDSHLDGLRWVEAKMGIVAKKVDKTIPEGVTVRVGSGLFSGMTGVVRRSKRGITLVCFNDRYSAEIPTSLLSADDAYRFQAATQLAA